MSNNKNASKEFHRILEEKIQILQWEIIIPPPVFQLMQGEFVDFNLEEGMLECRFPVREKFLNPYGNLQGGMVSVAIDNTVGPVSMIVAGPNFTRRMEIKFSKAIRGDERFIQVIARFIEQKKQILFFEAEVINETREIYASAKATHWIIKM